MNAEDSIHLFIASRSRMYCRQSTIDNYQRLLTHFVKQSRARLLADISIDSVRSYLSNMRNTGIAASTLKTKRALLLAWLTWLHNEGLIEESRWQQRVERPRQVEQLPRCMSEEECCRFLAVAKSMRHSTPLAAKREIAMLYLFLDTTLRESEMINIKLVDLDMDTQTVHVRTGDGRKSRRERLVPFGQSTARYLRAYLKVRKRHTSPYLWVTRDSPKPGRSLILQMVKRIARAAGLDDVCVHTLRHSAITILHRRGMPVGLIQRIAGHARMDMVMRYVRVTNDDVKRAYDEGSPMDRLMGT